MFAISEQSRVRKFLTLLLALIVFLSVLDSSLFWEVKLVALLACVACLLFELVRHHQHELRFDGERFYLDDTPVKLDGRSRRYLFLLALQFRTPKGTIVSYIVWRGLTPAAKWAASNREISMLKITGQL
ncbi:MAG: hypothetical protein COV52_03755 [Gammaproteobacteria bacterium CG11_big_fil_rev_8_21_14_0_20_46_22]|nr:MAG: hypothetical protein COW05_04940 [Gammaproteobacteria bacterium CG12_big_fil_rev_8_21_14_0_65_46_12]PIR11435.1 MAG: hypothetical protein COV52_03755 [Gammaproteobacteria bacterium CG11_big_fil_rev_8_21_14_0_20_46_22]